MENQGLRTLQKKRTSNFREDETKLLIQLWGSPQVQNKLYLTHRKAPVMRLLAANMQQRGFYRTPDEIKTRIRNLKCLYHRIKRSMQSGVGIGTVDPDWPHFKSMDEILSKRNQNRPQNLYKDGVFEGPRCEDIKQEIVDDIDINDDMESFTTNSLNGSDAEFEDEAHHMPPLTPKPLEAIQPLQRTKDDAEPIKIAPKPAPVPIPKVVPNAVQNVQIPIQAGIRTTNGTTSGLPFPLLILNGLPTATTTTQNHLQAINAKKEVPNVTSNDAKTSSDTSTLLANLLQIQTEQLRVEKQRLKLEKQKFKLHQLVGTQILILLPTLRTLVQKLENRAEEADSKNGVKRAHPDDGFDDLSDSKILKSVLEEGIKKYMMESMNESDDEDSGILNDDDDGSVKNKK